MRCVLLLVMTALTSAAACCAPSTREVGFGPAATLQEVPADFWLTATVVGPPRSGPLSAVPREVRPGRYVMEPDRQLRAALGTGATEQSFPPVTRRLSAEQVSELWTLTNANGLMNADHPAKAAQLPTFDGTWDGSKLAKSTYILVAHANGQRRVLMIDAEDAGAPGNAEARAIVGRLAEWAWVR